ncbi:MAG: homoserine kinase [Oceanococcaceae bacterium]
MSVFTPVSAEELSTFLTHYRVGELIEYTGIAEGIENTNFFVRTTTNRFVLTLFERTPAQDLPYFLAVMESLADAGLPSAAPVHRRDGEVLGELNGRPAALVARLSGGGVVVPNALQVSQLGAVMGQMHLALGDFTPQRPSDRGLDWMQQVAAQLPAQLSDDERALLTDELTVQQAAPWASLPRGVIHADLFRDNALFDEDRLTGLIDFYYACDGAWIYDLAVSFNDWVLNAGHPATGLIARALLQAYQQARPLEPAERGLWNLALRRAALRFWLSRLQDWHFPRGGELTYRKDPGDFERLLRWHRHHDVPL